MAKLSFTVGSDEYRKTPSEWRRVPRLTDAAKLDRFHRHTLGQRIHRDPRGWHGAVSANCYLISKSTLLVAPNAKCDLTPRVTDLFKFVRHIAFPFQTRS